MRRPQNLKKISHHEKWEIFSNFAAFSNCFNFTCKSRRPSHCSSVLTSADTGIIFSFLPILMLNIHSITMKNQTQFLLKTDLLTTNVKEGMPVKIYSYYYQHNNWKYFILFIIIPLHLLRSPQKTCTYLHFLHQK